MRIKLNIAMSGYAKGQTITIKDDNGIPLDPFWNNRLKDSKIDKCIEIVQTKSIETKSTNKRNSGSSS